MKHSDLEPVVTVRHPNGSTTELTSKDLRNATANAKQKLQVTQLDTEDVTEDQGTQTT